MRRCIYDHIYSRLRRRYVDCAAGFVVHSHTAILVVNVVVVAAVIAVEIVITIIIIIIIIIIMAAAAAADYCGTWASIERR